MPVASWIRRLMCAAVMLQVAACGDIGAPCGPGFRLAAATGDIIGDPGQVLGTVSLNLAESQDTSQSNLSVTTQGASSLDAQVLRGHIVRLRILGAEGRVFFDPPVEQLASSVSAGPLIQNINIPVPDPATMADLRAQFVAGVLLVELTTDETPARQFIVSTKVTSASNDFVRAICL
jgi:hypothetical protein